MLFICLVWLRFLMTLELPYILLGSNYAWKYRYNDVSFLFVIVMYFLLRHNYVIYLFGLVTFFDDVRITLYFGTFKLCTEITFVCNQNMTKKYIIIT